MQRLAMPNCTFSDCLSPVSPENLCFQEKSITYLPLIINVWICVIAQMKA